MVKMQDQKKTERTENKYDKANKNINNAKKGSGIALTVIAAGIVLKKVGIPLIKSGVKHKGQVQ